MADVQGCPTTRYRAIQKKINFYSPLKFYLIHLKIKFLAELLALLKFSLKKLDLSIEVEDISLRPELPPFCFFVSPQSLQIILLYQRG